MSNPTLFLNHIPDLDCLIALEFGRVDDGQPHENWRGVNDRFGYLCDEPDGNEVGFKIVKFSEFDGERGEVSEIWSGPRFNVPALGLTDATAGEITAASQALLVDGPGTPNRHFFTSAIEARERGDLDEALQAWIACLFAGDSMAHFGLGYTCYELGLWRKAYDHLRHYSQIAPNLSWVWCWYGKAAEAVSETGEARRAFERALELAGPDDGAEEEAKSWSRRLDVAGL